MTSAFIRPLRTLDNLLNTVTMYRLVLYVLGTLAAITVFFGFTGALSQAPLAQVESLAVLLAVCYGANKLLAILFDAAPNAESSLITALILFFILLPPFRGASDLALIAGAGLIAMASKYVLAIRRRHLFNPAAIAAFIMSLSGLYIAGWWIATPAMVPFMLLGGFLVVRKIRRVQLATTFVVVAVLVLVAVGSSHGLSLGYIITSAFTSWPILFFSSIMLTEPATLPSRHRDQLLYAAVIGALFSSQLHWGRLATTPQAVLLLGNVVVWFITPKFTQRLKLLRQVAIGRNVTEFIFALERPITYTPGQYLEFTLPHSHIDSRGNRRTFSIASSPTEPELHLGIKFYEPSSSFKNALRALQPGSVLATGSLNGNFILPSDATRKLVLMAGGIGITPFRSMLKYLVDTKQHRDIVLLYAISAPEELAFQDVLDAAATVGVRTVPVLGPAAPPPGWTGATGFITAELIKQTIPDYAERWFYISGPPMMVDRQRDNLRSLKVPPARIKTDHFAGY